MFKGAWIQLNKHEFCYIPKSGWIKLEQMKDYSKVNCVFPKPFKRTNIISLLPFRYSVSRAKNVCGIYTKPNTTHTCQVTTVVCNKTNESVSRFTETDPYTYFKYILMPCFYFSADYPSKSDNLRVFVEIKSRRTVP